ncbi:hypothetical protein FACS189419_06910 [Planctomycetales bacterium]|nr:hypothetical protein FACS189419_06910 [Planctomycetales bacterium]
MLVRKETVTMNILSSPQKFFSKTTEQTPSSQPPTEAKLLFEEIQTRYEALSRLLEGKRKLYSSP